jgi:hypothetical protein
MYSLYIDTAHDGVFHMRYTGVVVTKQSDGSLLKTPVFNFDGTFDNADSKGYGADLLFEPGLDTNLRAAIVYKVGRFHEKPAFQPLADGIIDMYYGASNDLQQIGLGACASVANPGNLVSNPMPCF